MKKLLTCAALLLLPGCATVVTGTSQTVVVSSNPSGASCTTDHGGAIPSTPGAVSVGKSGSDLTVTCSKPGYRTASVSAPSSFNSFTFINLTGGLLYGAVAMLVDAATGGNFDYPALVTVNMTPIPGQPSSPAPIARSGTTPGRDRIELTTRMMALPDNAPQKRAFLRQACRTGDQTACILTRSDRQASRSNPLHLY